MALTTGIRLNHILFQLVKDQGEVWSGQYRVVAEVDVQELVVLPNSITYEYQGRNVTYQTLTSIFLDKFPPAPVKISFRGTFGSELRRQGLTMKSGHTRMQEFRDVMTLGYWTELADDEVADLFGLSGSQFGSLVAEDVRPTDDEFLMINCYDFWMQERYQVDINRVRLLNESERHPTLTFYEFDLTAIGDPMTVVGGTSDPTLRILQKVDKFFTDQATEINQAMAALETTPAYQIAALGAEGIELLGDDLQSALQSIANVQQVLHDAVSGNSALQTGLQDTAAQIGGVL